MNTWRKLIAEELESKAPNEKIIACTLTEAELDVEFEDTGGIGDPNEGAPFTAWSPTRVFFPVGIDGTEWVGSAPRNVCDEACEHEGWGE